MLIPVYSATISSFYFINQKPLFYFLWYISGSYATKKLRVFERILAAK